MNQLQISGLLMMATFIFQAGQARAEEPEPGATPSPEVAAFKRVIPFEITGHDQPFQSRELPVNGTLRLTLSAVPGISLVRTSSLAFLYSCVRFNVTVGDTTKTVTISTETPTTGSATSVPCLSENGKRAERSANLDFSSTVQRLHLKTAVLTVSKAQYDWPCLYVSPAYCPMTPIYRTHVLQGLLEVDNGSASSAMFDQEYSFQVSSSIPFRTTVQPSPILKVSIRPLESTLLAYPSPGTYSGFNGASFPYGCAEFDITVGSKTVETQVLSLANGLNELCPNAPHEQIIDFSDRLPEDGKPVLITVSNPKYDWSCRYLSPLFCPVSTVYRTHSISATIDVKRN